MITQDARDRRAVTLTEADQGWVPAAVHAATRRLLAVSRPEEALGIVAGLVREMGGYPVVDGLATDDPAAIEITLGKGAHLVVTATPGSAARDSLEKHLPALVEDARRALQLARRFERLARDAGLDRLTGLPDRRSMGRLIGRLREGDMLIAIDLDGFEAVNQRWGRDRGDEVLCTFSRALQQTTRADESCGRMGGEEFLVILRHASEDSSMWFLNRLRDGWESDRTVALTFSAGAALVRDSGWRAAMLAADRSLLRAKEDGRDRWAVAVPKDYC